MVRYCARVATIGAQPQLQGELLGELGRMYMRLDEIDAAMPVLDEAIALLEKHASPGDAALNRARAYLAAAWLQTSDDLQRTGALAAAGTRVLCVAGVPSARKSVSMPAAHSARSLRLRAMTNARCRKSGARVADAELAFGAAHEDIAMQLLHLAMVARNAGHLVEASDAVTRALSISRNLRMRAADRTDLERTMAILDYDLGHYAAARNRLVALQARAGDRNERALLSRLLANVELELGDAEARAARMPNRPSRISPGRPVGRSPGVRLAGECACAGTHGPARTTAIKQIDDVQQRLHGAGSAAGCVRSIARAAIPRRVPGAGRPRCAGLGGSARAVGTPRRRRHFAD